MKSFEKKKGYYPEGWLIVPLKAEDVLKPGFAL